MGSSHEMVKNVHISFLSCVIIGRTLYMACMPLPQWPNGGGGVLEWVVESTTVTHSSADWWDLLLPLA